MSVFEIVNLGRGKGRDVSFPAWTQSCVEDILTIKACILTESHLKTALEVVRDKPELRSVIPLLEEALIEVEVVRRTQVSSLATKTTRSWKLE